MSSMRFTLLVLLSIIHQNAGDTITIFPKNPYGIENENFEIRVDVTPSYRLCSFSLGEIAVNATYSPPGLSFWEDATKSMCKLRLEPLKNQLKGPWKVTIVNSTKLTSSLSFGIAMKEAVAEPDNIVETAVVGSKYTHSCSSGRSREYVKIYSPDGSLYSEGPKGEISIPFVRSQDAGMWKCVSLYSGTIIQKTYYLILNVTSSNVVETKVEERKEDVTLVCRYPGTASTASCLFETANGTMLASKPGVFTDRYSFYGNDSAKECGLAIRKPLLHTEIGIWKCLIASPEYASFLHVSTAGTKVSDKFELDAGDEKRNVSVVAGTALTLQCKLRQRLTYCYLMSPSGRVFSSLERDSSAAKYTGQGLGQGDCTITVDALHVWSNDTGNWTCGMGAEDAVDDVQVKVFVQIAGNQFGAERSVYHGVVGESVEMRCSSVMGYGLEYCRFMHPSGRSLSVGMHTTAGRYAYLGNGLDAGDCGLNITELQEEDFGKWICASSFVGTQWPYEFRDEIILSQSPMKSVTLIGMSAVLGLLAMGLIAGLIFWESRRRQRSRSSAVGSFRYGARVSQGSDDSEVVGPDSPTGSHSS